MLMQGKRGVVVGVANRWSIAWAIAQRLAAEGAELAITYRSERRAKQVKSLVAELGSPLMMAMDVSSDRQIMGVFDQLKSEWGSLDFVLHAVAFAPGQALSGGFKDTSREDFRATMDASAYSLTAIAHGAAPLMAGGGSLLTLSYLGSKRVVPGYGVMGVAKAGLEASVRYLAHDLGPSGIRVNALSTGPIKTLAASGISGFSTLMRHHRTKAPLQRDTDPVEVADAALFLLGDMGRGVTGQVLYVDGGYSIMAV